MTMLSFRVEEAEARDLEHWAEALGIDRSQLLREALHRHLATLKGAEDADRWEASPLTEAEGSLADVADWGPAEDWTDWADAPR